MKDDAENIELNIHIGCLVLDGIYLTFYQQQQLKETIETQLCEMFTVNGIPKEIQSLSKKTTSSSILLDQQPFPVQLGKQIASSIYDGVNGGNSKNFLVHNRQSE